MFGYFYIRAVNDNKYLIDFRDKEIDDVDITEYLHAWALIGEITNYFHPLTKSHRLKIKTIRTLLN